MKNGMMAIFVALFALSAHAVDITVDADAGRKPISPWIYGKNNSLSDDPAKPVTAANWQIYREAGLRMLRECGGNNCTKYNWSKKLSSHPDWYNNVYDHSWDFLVKSLIDSTSNTQALMGFQLLGKAASNKSNNFNDWAYNQSQWWSGVGQNLAGGGTVNPAGGDSALKDGDPNLYLMDWPADSTTAILDHWFGTGGLGYDKNRLMYWNMDNEPEIWASTHDDALPVNITAEEFVQRYFKVAKLARQKYPAIKLVGFVACNEWQWYAWNNTHVTVTEGGVQKKYTWAEFFIKRIGEEQKTSGVRLLDVLDFHFYPGTGSDADLTMQLHRVWFDTTCVFPKANGCKLIGGGWDDNIKKEYILERCRRWLAQYCGQDHGITLGVTECGDMYKNDPSVVAVWYASQLGTFADEGVELFTPWEWNVGQWEVLHLFSRYCGATRVTSTSGLDSLVSAYSSISKTGDTLTMILVNRDRSNSKSAAVTVNNYAFGGTTFSTLQLNDLPSGTETFKSHTSNALKQGTISISGNKFSIDLPTVSVTAVILTGNSPVINTLISSFLKKVSLVTRGNVLFILSKTTIKNATISLYDLKGRPACTWIQKNLSASRFSLEGLSAGRYVVTINNQAIKQPIVVIK